MANLRSGERTQMERYDLQPGRTRQSARERRAVTLANVIGLIVLAALVVAAVGVFSGWPHLIVIGDLLILFFGLAAWVNPRRKHI